VTAGSILAPQPAVSSADTLRHLLSATHNAGVWHRWTEGNRPTRMVRAHTSKCDRHEHLPLVRETLHLHRKATSSMKCDCMTQSLCSWGCAPPAHPSSFGQQHSKLWPQQPLWIMRRACWAIQCTVLYQHARSRHTSCKLTARLDSCTARGLEAEPSGRQGSCRSNIHQTSCMRP
jgi:hypothetical protein